MTLTSRLRMAYKGFTMRFGRTPGYGQYFLPRSSVNYAAEVGDGMGSSTVMAPLLWVMRNAPEAPFCVEAMKGDEYEVIPDHDLTALLERPNEAYGGDTLVGISFFSLFLTGDFYWFIERGERSITPQKLWWVPTNMVEPKWPSDGSVFISHYEYRPDGGAPINLDPDDVVHVRYGVNPRNPRRGISPIHPALREVFTDDEAANYTATLLRNVGVPGVMISPDGDYAVPDEAPETVKQKFLEKTTGDRRGEPLILTAPSKVERLSFSPSEMDLTALRRIPEERISALIGIHPSVVGLGAGLDRSTYNNMEEARRSAYQEALVPIWKLIGTEIRHQLLGNFEPDPRKFRTRFKTDEVKALQEDRNEQANRLRADAQAALITRADYLRATGREAEERDEVYLMPFNIIEVPADGSGPVGPTPPDKGRGHKSVAGGPDASRAQRDLIASFNRQQREYQEEMTSDLEVLFRQLGRDCATAYIRIEDRKGETNGGTKQDEDEFESLVNRIIASAEVSGFAGSKLRPTFEDYYEQVLFRTRDTLSVSMGIEVDIPDTMARRVLNEGGTRAGLVDVIPDTRRSLLRALEEGRANGEGVRTLARRIRSEVPAGRFRTAGPRYRSQLIARTETKYAQNRASLELYRASDTITGLLAFDAQGPGTSDEDCEERNGQVFTVEEAEHELSLEHPGGTLSFAPVTNPALVPEGATVRS